MFEVVAIGSKLRTSKALRPSPCCLLSQPSQLPQSILRLSGRRPAHSCPSCMVAFVLPVAWLVRSCQSYDQTCVSSHLDQSLDHRFKIFHRAEHERVNTHRALHTRLELRHMFRVDIYKPAVSTSSPIASRSSRDAVMLCQASLG